MRMEQTKLDSGRKKLLLVAEVNVCTIDFFLHYYSEGHEKIKPEKFKKASRMIVFS